MSDTPAKFDPRFHLAPYDVTLRAHMLYLREQDSDAWASRPVPEKPLGRLKYEGLRLLAVFAVPLALMAGVYHSFGFSLAFLGSVVSGSYLGYLMHVKNMRDIQKKLNDERAVDRGRFEGQNWIAFHLGMDVQEYTYPMLEKMAVDAQFIQDFKNQLRDHMRQQLHEEKHLPEPTPWVRNFIDGKNLEKMARDQLNAEPEYRNLYEMFTDRIYWKRTGKRPVRREPRQAQGQYHSIPSNAAHQHGDYGDSPMPGLSYQNTGFPSPIVNTDGTAMVGDSGVDVSGKPFGV